MVAGTPTVGSFGQQVSSPNLKELLSDSTEEGVQAVLIINPFTIFCLLPKAFLITHHYSAIAQGALLPVSKIFNPVKLLFPLHLT